MAESDRQTTDEKPVEPQEEEAYEEFLLDGEDREQDTCEAVPVLPRKLLRKISAQS